MSFILVLAHEPAPGIHTDVVVTTADTNEEAALKFAIHKYGHDTPAHQAVGVAIDRTAVPSYVQMILNASAVRRKGAAPIDKYRLVRSLDGTKLVFGGEA